MCHIYKSIVIHIRICSYIYMSHIYIYIYIHINTFFPGQLGSNLQFHDFEKTHSGVRYFRVLDVSRISQEALGG